MTFAENDGDGNKPEEGGKVVFKDTTFNGLFNEKTTKAIASRE